MSFVTKPIPLLPEKLEMNLILNDGKSDINDNGIIINFLSPTQELLNDFYLIYLDK